MCSPACNRRFHEGALHRSSAEDTMGRWNRHQHRPVGRLERRQRSTQGRRQKGAPPCRWRRSRNRRQTLSAAFINGARAKPGLQFRQTARRIGARCAKDALSRPCGSTASLRPSAPLPTRFFELDCETAGSTPGVPFASGPVLMIRALGLGDWGIFVIYDDVV